MTKDMSLGTHLRLVAIDVALQLALSPVATILAAVLLLLFALVASIWPGGLGVSPVELLGVVLVLGFAGLLGAILFSTAFPVLRLAFRILREAKRVRLALYLPWAGYWLLRVAGSLRMPNEMPPEIAALFATIILATTLCMVLVDVFPDRLHGSWHRIVAARWPPL